MPKCQTCGEIVSNAYARVNGDNDGVVHECRHCPTEDLDQHKEYADSGMVQQPGEFLDLVPEADSA